jgi:hypothetical protein
MVSLGMHGPYKLTADKINHVVTRKSAGNYALGHINTGFTVRYVGRSDNDIKARLKSWVGKEVRYKHFEFSYTASCRKVFNKHCKNYHDFGGSKDLDNKKHPERPDGTEWKCSVCGK